MPTILPGSDHPVAEPPETGAAGLRVLLLNYEYPPLGGGAGVATAALAHRLAGRGAEVDVVTSDPGGLVRRSRHVEPERPHRGLAVYRVRAWRKGVHQAGLGGAASYLAAALPTVRRLAARHRYDIVHCFFSLPTGALLPVAGLNGVPVVVSLRGSDVPGYDRSNRALDRMHRVCRPLTRHIWRRADRVTVVCEALGHLARATQPDLRFTVIRNGVDLERFTPAPSPRTPPGDVVRCLAVARLVERKGLIQLLQAWALLGRGRFQLEIAGDGEQAPLLQRMIGDLGLADDVRLLGALDHAALAERYRAADLFTLAPNDEAFGNVFAEALAAGLPIVGSNVGGIPDLVRHEENGLLVPPGNPEALARAIRRLANDPVLWVRMAARNRARAQLLLSWDRAVEGYLSVYRELLPGAPAARALAPELVLTR